MQLENKKTQFLARANQREAYNCIMIKVKFFPGGQIKAYCSFLILH